MDIREQIAALRGWNAYISHCAEHDLEITGSDYDKTADYLNSAADTMEKLLAVYEAAKKLQVSGGDRASGNRYYYAHGATACRFRDALAAVQTRRESK